MPLGLPLELEVCSAVLSGRSAGQHQSGLHQDTEEELVLDRLRGPDGAVVQHPWQSLKILQITSLDRTDEPRYLVIGAGAGHSTRLPGRTCRRRAGLPILNILNTLTYFIKEKFAGAGALISSQNVTELPKTFF